MKKLLAFSSHKSWWKAVSEGQEKEPLNIGMDPNQRADKINAYFLII